MISLIRRARRAFALISFVVVAALVGNSAAAVPFPSGMLMGRAAAAAAWTTVLSRTLNVDSSGWAGYSARQVLAAASLTDATGSQIRITLKGPASGQIAVTKMYVQVGAGSGSYAFSTTPVQVFVGGSASFTVGTGATVLTDAVTLGYDGTHDIVISIYTSGATSYAINQTANADTHWYKLGDDAATVGATGYTQTFNTYDTIPLVEAFV